MAGGGGAMSCRRRGKGRGRRGGAGSGSRRRWPQLEAERQAAEREAEAKAAQFRARREAGERTGRGPAGAEVALAQENLARVRAAREAQLAGLEERYAAGRPRRGRGAGVEDYCRVREAAAQVERARERAAEAERKAAEAAGPGPVRNITDPDSRLMPTRNGFIQGYNTQNVTSEDGLVIATELTDDPCDMAWFAPMMEQAAAAAALIGAHCPPGPGPDSGGERDSGPGGIGLALADAGYCSEANLTCDGPDRLIATGNAATWRKPPATANPKARSRTGAAPPSRPCANG